MKPHGAAGPAWAELGQDEDADAADTLLLVDAAPPPEPKPPGRVAERGSFSGPASPSYVRPTLAFGSCLRSRNTALATIFIAGWYTLSTAINVFNKWFFGRGKLEYHYPYPVFVTSCHMLVHTIISFVVLYSAWPDWRPTKVISGWDYGTKIMPCAFAAGVDIALTNSSLQYITLSFATMIKSAAPIVILFFSFLFGLEQPRFALLIIIVTISAGTALMVFGELRFVLAGFVSASLATLASGLRWTLTHLLLAKEELGINNPVATNLYLAPAMAICMLLVGLALEGLPRMADKGPELFLYVGLSGTVAWALVMFEYGVIMTAGALTFSVAGIFKEILTIAVSHLVFGDQLQAVNLIGLGISLSGIIAYNAYKLSSMGELQMHGGKGKART